MRRKVSVASALDDYGVVVQRGEVLSYELDVEATEARRTELRASRAPLRLMDWGSYAEQCVADGSISFDDDE